MILSPILSLSFEWDAEKNRANIAKHGIDFRRGVFVFSDPFAFEYGSERNGESRKVKIGLAMADLIAVVFVERGEVIRIISARAARRTERRDYEQGETS